MKYFLFFYIIYVSVHSAEQQLIVLKPSESIHGSHEMLQLDPATAQTKEVELPSDEASINGEDSSDHKGGLDNESKVEEPVNQSSKKKSKIKGSPLFIDEIPSNFRGKGPWPENGDEKIPHWNRWVSEIAAANNADVSGTNPHIHQPSKYPDFGRRFVLQYPYTEKEQNVLVAPDNKDIVPIEAPLEVVKKVAKQSALEEAAKPQDNVVNSAVLRSGDFWNAVWVENVDSKSALRMSDQHVLGTIKAQIQPGSEFYDLVASMTKISPRLLYIINDKKG